MAAPQSAPLQILIVDFDDHDGSRLADELTGDAFELTVVSSEDAATELVARNHFDAAVIEVEDARGPGVGLLRRLRREHPDTRVLIMTPCGDDDLWAFVLEEGASDLVPMPVRRDDLAALLG